MHIRSAVPRNAHLVPDRTGVDNYSILLLGALDAGLAGPNNTTTTARGCGVFAWAGQRLTK